MNLSEAENLLVNERTACSKPGLSRVNELLARLDYPGKNIPLIHIVGTNGKGSTLTMLSAVFTETGIPNGSFQSPRLSGPTDYFRINGKLPEETAFCEAVKRVINAAETMEDYPTEFELCTVVALCLFEAENCRVMLLEAGMGGSKDATNLPYPSLLTVITHIALDHTEYLGATPEDILTEKMGIVKPYETVVLSENDSRIYEKAAEIASLEELFLVPADLTKDITEYRKHLPLKGTYQEKNLRTVLTALDLLGEFYPILDEHILLGLRNAAIPFRFMTVKENPDIIFDGGHNPDCIRELVASVKERNADRKYLLVTGVMKDKAYPEMYELLNEITCGYVTLTAPNRRALSAEALAEHLSTFGKPVFCANSLENAAEYALKQWKNGANILCAGSLYFMTDLYREFEQRLNSDSE